MDINQKTHILSILNGVVSELEYKEVEAALTAVVQNGTADLAALPNTLDVATLREVLADFLEETASVTSDTAYHFIAQLGVCGLSIVPNTQLAAIRRANVLDSLPTAEFANKALETADLIKRLLAIAGPRQEQTPRTFNGMVTQALDVLEERLATAATPAPDVAGGADPDAVEANPLAPADGGPFLSDDWEEDELSEIQAFANAAAEGRKATHHVVDAYTHHVPRLLRWIAALTPAPATASPAPIIAIAQPSAGPAKCSPLSCDGCPNCEPQVAQVLPVEKGGHHA